MDGQTFWVILLATRSAPQRADLIKWWRWWLPESLLLMFMFSDDTVESCASENAACAPEQPCQDDIDSDVDDNPDINAAIAASLAADRWGPKALYFLLHRSHAAVVCTERRNDREVLIQLITSCLVSVWCLVYYVDHCRLLLLFSWAVNFVTKMSSYTLFIHWGTGVCCVRLLQLGILLE